MRGDVGEELGWERRGREPEGDGGDRESAEERVGGRDAGEDASPPGAPGSCTPSSDGLWVRRTALWDRALLLAETLLGDGSPPVCLPPPCLGRLCRGVKARGRPSGALLSAACCLESDRKARRAPGAGGAGPPRPLALAPLSAACIGAEGGGRGVEQEGADRP